MHGIIRCILLKRLEEIGRIHYHLVSYKSWQEMHHGTTKARSDEEEVEEHVTRESRIKTVFLLQSDGSVIPLDGSRGFAEDWDLLEIELDSTLNTIPQAYLTTVSHHGTAQSLIVKSRTKLQYPETKLNLFGTQNKWVCLSIILLITPLLPIILGITSRHFVSESPFRWLDSCGQEDESDTKSHGCCRHSK